MSSTPRFHNRRAALIAAAGCLCVAVACGGSAAEGPRPVPSLSESSAAQEAFQRIQRKWSFGTVEQRLQLGPELERFLARHGGDDRARLVRVYLGWIHLQHGRLELARQFVAPVRRGPEGAVHDFADVVEAAILLREQRAEPALSLLRPLDGKIVDAQQRSVYGEQLALAHLALRHWPEAIAAMLDWVAEARPADREGVQSVVADFVSRVPEMALERELGRLDDRAGEAGESRTRAPARAWMRQLVRDRLARQALEGADAKLAQRLVSAGGSVARFGDKATALVRLASEGNVVPRVAGRSVGLMLSLSTPDARRRSSQVAAGMSRALRGTSPDDPGAIQLLLADDGGEVETTSAALAELSGAGAAIVVGGVDAQGADEMVRFARERSMPAIILAQPTASELPPFAFVLGHDAAAAEAVLRGALAERGLASIASVGGAGSPCDAAPQAAGLPRFPVGAWKTERIEALVLLGDPACARDALSEARALPRRPVFAFGFECAELFGSAGGQELAASAGVFPASEALRGKSWFEVLGHDAAVLAAAAIERFPLEVAQAPETVSQLHALARKQLLTTQAALWSTERRGFDGAQRLRRAYRVESSSERSGAVQSKR